MSLVTNVLEWLQSLPPAGIIAGAGLLVFGETTLGLGFIAPGETGLFILGTTANSVPRFLLMWVVTTLCAVAGDSVGYYIGKKLGPRLRQTKVVQKHGAQGWDKATAVLQKRGAWAVLIAIFIPVLRTLVPAAAGASSLPFRKFLPAVFVGATAWCALHIGIGAAAGEAAKKIEDVVGRGSWILFAIVAIAIAVVVIVRRKKNKSSEIDGNDAGTDNAAKTTVSNASSEVEPENLSDSAGSTIAKP